MSESFSEPVVSVIIERPGPPQEVLLQERSKVEAGQFRGLLELPQGRLRQGETILECAEREVLEETGLVLFSPTTQVQISEINGEVLAHGDFQVVCESGVHSFLAVCIVGTAEGTPRGSEESTNPQWYGRTSILELLRSNRVFPLNVPMLQRFLST